MLADYLKLYFKDQELRDIFKDVIGTDQPKEIQPLLDKQTRKYLNSSIKDILFIQSSIGVVFGFLLENNQKITLKVYSPKLSESYLNEMNYAQDIFYKENFPAPQVLTPIFTFGNTHAGIYQLIDGEKEDGHKAVIRSELAKYLAEFIKIVDKHKIQPMKNFFQQAAKRLWPIPHNVLFNLEKSSKGAGWIAKKALQAKKIIANKNFKKILAHTDWGVKNSIFQNNKLAGIFDWDSLGAMSEAEMVGRAAAQFTADWDSEYKITPSPQEGRLFVEEYQKYRGKKFTTDEYEIISASADYLISIISRFEHAGNNPKVHPYQDLLKICEQKSFLFAEE